MTDKIKEKLLKEMDDLDNYYGEEISQETKERKKQWKENPRNYYFELKAKLQQHEETKEDILEKIDDWWRNTMQISSTSTRLGKLKKEILK